MYDLRLKELFFSRPKETGRLRANFAHTVWYSSLQSLEYIRYQAIVSVSPEVDDLNGRITTDVNPEPLRNHQLSEPAEDHCNASIIYHLLYVY